MNKNKKYLLAQIILVVLVLSVFAQVVHFDFIDFDDPVYVTKNPFIQDGLTWTGICWAMTADIITHSPHADYWQPVTMLSRMIDVEIFGMEPFGHHLTNLILHLLNAAIFFSILYRVTNSIWAGLFAALLFALHPMRAESVAWVTERKDVLSAFFWLLSIRAYCIYVKTKKGTDYLNVFVLFALGLMSKPIVVTLPAILLIFDYWPLKRFYGQSMTEKTFHKLVVEKVPLFALSAIGIGITMISGHDLKVTDSNILAQMFNGLPAISWYLMKMFHPVDLGLWYPHEVGVIGKQGPIFTSALILALVTRWVFRFGEKMPFIVMGWMWFIVTLLPVIAGVTLVPYADRFTYIPHMGLAVALSWLCSYIVLKVRLRKWVVMACSGFVIFTLIKLSVPQTAVWRNSISVFTHTLSVTKNNWHIHRSIGASLYRGGEVDLAIEHFEEALRIDPDYADAHDNLGFILEARGKYKEAVNHYREAIRLEPDFSRAHYNLGHALTKIGLYSIAVEHLGKAVQIIESNRDNEFFQMDQPGDVSINFSENVRLMPNLASAYNEYGIALMHSGNIDKAFEQFTEAVRLYPDFSLAHDNIGLVYAFRGEIENAVVKHRHALKINPKLVNAMVNLGSALAVQNNLDGAIEQYRAALEIDLDHPSAHFNLGNTLIKRGEREEGLIHLRRAHEIEPEDKSFKDRLDNVGSR